MQIAYLHVVINHLPIMGMPIAVALLALGAWARSAPIQRAALGLVVALGLATVAVWLAGQGGEDFVEHLPGVSEAAIERHEDMAGIALGATLALAALAGIVFLAGDGPTVLTRREATRPVPRAGAWSVLVGGVLVSALLGYTGKLGGQIRHTEFADATLSNLAVDPEDVAEALEQAREEAEDAEEDRDEHGGPGRH